MPYTLKKFIECSSQILSERKSNLAMRKTRRLVEDILEAPTSPSYQSAETDFDRMLRNSEGPPEYGYDPFSSWRRGLHRTLQLSKEIPEFPKMKRALEVACGDGMCMVLLQSYGLDLQGVDLRDWRDARAQEVPFCTVNLDDESSSLPGNNDFVYSYNAFEHFGNPEHALAAMVDSMHPGGYLFLEFGPLYCSPWGLHAYRMLPVPYLQFLVSEPYWRARIQETGVQDLGIELADLQPLNKWTVSQFEGLWKATGCEVLQSYRTLVDSHLDIILRYPDSFCGRGLTFDDVVTQSLQVLLRKPVQGM